jgi:hypothetical protein
MGLVSILTHFHLDRCLILFRPFKCLNALIHIRQTFPIIFQYTVTFIIYQYNFKSATYFNKSYNNPVSIVTAYVLYVGQNLSNTKNSSVHKHFHTLFRDHPVTQ